MSTDAQQSEEQLAAANSALLEAAMGGRYGVAKQAVASAAEKVMEAQRRQEKVGFTASMEKMQTALLKTRAEWLSLPTNAPQSIDADVQAATTLAATCLSGSDVDNLAENYSLLEEQVRSQRLNLTEAQIKGDTTNGSSSTSTLDSDSTAHAVELAMDAYRSAQEHLDETAQHIKDHQHELRAEEAQALAWQCDHGGFPHWRLKYYVETMSTKDNKVEFEGGVITDCNGKVLWDVVCMYCSVQIQRGAYGCGTPRVVRLDASDTGGSCCQFCWTLWTSIHARFPSHPTFTRANVAEFHFAPPDITMDIEEADEHTMSRVAMLQRATELSTNKEPNMVTLLDAAFAQYSKRPCLGGSNPAPDTSSYHWVSFEELRWKAKGALSAYLSCYKEQVSVNLTDEDLATVNSTSWGLSPTQRLLMGSESPMSTEDPLVPPVAPDTVPAQPPQLSFMGITSQNRWEYIAMDMACIYAGYVSVGLHTTHTECELVDIINHCGIRALCCDGAQLTKYLRIVQKTNVTLLLCMDSLPLATERGLKTTPLKNGAGGKVVVSDFPNVLEKWRRGVPEVIDDSCFPADTPSIDPVSGRWTNGCTCPGWSSLLSIIYTSGSTGSPKGVLHSEPHFRIDVGHSLNIQPLVTISYIPLSHSTDRMRVYETMLNGGRCGFAQYAHSNWTDHEMNTGSDRFQLLRNICSDTSTSGGGSDNGVCEIAREISLLRPTIFIAPPRVWKGFEHVLKAAETNLGNSSSAEEVLRDVFGRRLRVAATGGGPTDASTFAFVKRLFDLDLMESYGATEAGAIAVGSNGAKGMMALTEGVHVILAPAAPQSAASFALDSNGPTPLQMSLSLGQSSRRATVAPNTFDISGRHASDGPPIPITASNLDGSLHASFEAGVPGSVFESPLMNKNKPLPTSGELYVSTPTVTEGYWRNYQATADALYYEIVSPTAVNAPGSFGTATLLRRYFKTGDICEVEYADSPPDEGGNVFRSAPRITACRVVDRKKNMLSLSGAELHDASSTIVKMSVEELEASIADLHPAICNVAVVSVPVKQPRYVAVVSMPSFCFPSIVSAESGVVVEDNLAHRQAAFETQLLANARPLMITKQLVPPVGVVVDSGPAWEPNPTNRYLGLLTVSLKVNRVMVAHRFEEEIRKASGKYATPTSKLR